jgi:hypothetical protein
MTTVQLIRYNDANLEGTAIMQQIQLNDQLYKKAQRRASEAGFASVDEYIAEVLSHDLTADNNGNMPNLDHLFTPERLAHIDKAAEDIKAGNFYTSEQAQAELAKRREEWIRKNPR